MRKLTFVKKDVLLYSVIVMVLLLGIFVEDSLGSGPMCSPCGVYDFDSCYGSSGGWRCMGCDTDYGACYSCDSSGHCADRCNPAIDCKSCTMEVVHMPCGDRMRALGCTHNDCYPELCQTCIGGVCTVCDGNEFRMCCDGTCFDRRIKQCCWNNGNGYICDSNKECCSGICKDKCQQNDNTSMCSTSKSTACPECAPLFGDIVYAKVYTGNTVPWCWGGCEGECGPEPDVPCYTRYRCDGYKDNIPNSWCIMGVGGRVCAEYEGFWCILVQPDPNSSENYKVLSRGCY